jgi:hypothetical protein
MEERLATGARSALEFVQAQPEVRALEFVQDKPQVRAQDDGAMVDELKRKV